MQREVPYLTGGYGLGLVRSRLSCGDVWGHAGFLPGYYTFGLATADGRHAFLTMNSTYPVNLLPPSPPVSAYQLFELALCG
jgi:D-alanyl-D-alanine carboxypeptidase